MIKNRVIKESKNVVVRFSGDSGDGMQLAGNIFSDASTLFGNDIITFPDYPAEVRAPQGTIGGVSGFQLNFGEHVHSPGDKADVLLAMNPAALKSNGNFIKKDTVIIVDIDAFTEVNLQKAGFPEGENPFEVMGLTGNPSIFAPVTSMCKSCLDGIAEGKAVLKTRNIFSLGLLCWLFERPVDTVARFVEKKFSKKPSILKANLMVLNAGYDYGHNTHASVPTYKIETSSLSKGLYIDIDGNRAIAYGLIAAAEKSGLSLYLSSYPITPATTIMQELAARKELGVKVVQAEDEISAVCSALGASYAGCLAATSTSGPGFALKSEAIGLAVMAELPVIVVDVQRSGPSTGMPTKTEQADLLQALYGRNGESPVVVIAATSPVDCFSSAFMAAKLAVEHMVPVILLSDSYIANGSSAWNFPDMENLPSITPPYVKQGMEKTWTPYYRDIESGSRYWAVPGMKGFEHRVGGLEKNSDTGRLSYDPFNHQKMINARKKKIEKIAENLPEQKIYGDKDADLLVVGWGGTFGHLIDAVDDLRLKGKKIALAHFKYINPLPANTGEMLLSYKKVLVVEQNSGQFASYLRSVIPGFTPCQFDKVEGQPFKLENLEEELSGFFN